ncbi:MAG: 30S ribosomal protein S8 [Opitutales bacterium]|nr:30S ribosomal protein S8 [Opitutales bacterium]MCH8539882.1 30S ribosomal protein S8 [Opitutales bacterium]
MDPISDFLTVIRNASRAGKPTCAVQHSKMKEAIARILKEEGYISKYEDGQDDRGHKTLMVTLKYADKTAVIHGIKRVSKPGLRTYFHWNEIPRTLGGLGIGILTTSKGLMNDREARRQRLGGELVCSVW